MIYAPDHTHPFLFFHVPKTGGMSITKTLEQYHFKVSPKILEDSAFGVSHAHYRADEFQRNLPRAFKRCHAFAFTRNPWSRRVSLWLEFQKEKETREALLDSFGSFEDWILWMGDTSAPWKDTSKAFIRERPIQSMVLLRPQHWFIGKHLDTYARFESFDFWWGFLAEKLDLPRQLPRANCSRYPKGMQDYRKWYSSKTADIVKHVYSECAYAYDFDSGERDFSRKKIAR